ncbi:MAG: sigma-54-dependent Fis family transcriptional regulator, partial [Bdellovibrionales bacterium]|nr:sigma-54-dependent Fis family transcriptional regulator [Bdellovibrionales bacterium]
RLNVIPLHIPALRERVSDIPVLFHHFITHFNKEKNRQIEGIHPDAMEALMTYNWPGNVRELENLVERISILKGKGIIQIEDLPEKYRKSKLSVSVGSLVQIPDNGLDFNAAVDAYENKLIMQALEKTEWNRNQAAKLLRLNRTTLVEKIKKKGLTTKLADAE